MNYSCKCGRIVSEWELVKNGGICDRCNADKGMMHQVKCRANGCNKRHYCKVYDVSAENIKPIAIVLGECFMFVEKEGSKSGTNNSLKITN